MEGQNKSSAFGRKTSAVELLHLEQTPFVRPNQHIYSLISNSELSCVPKQLRQMSEPGVELTGNVPGKAASKISTCALACSSYFDVQASVICI